MPVNLQAPNPSDLFPVPGVKLGIAMAGVRKANRRDLTVITVPEGAQVAGVVERLASVRSAEVPRPTRSSACGSQRRGSMR